MTVAVVILAVIALAGIPGAFVFGWRRGYWRGYDTGWYRRGGGQGPAPRVPAGTSGGGQ